ncbi:MAG: LysM peptidoglycan-binding domain-containing protein, partial [Myxococcales bacterium]|nr:LysM peptidoglycan-binding domain-containing protein [Myxococcales bacterium]
KYNTNDYWELRRLEAGLPYETALYVPKIMAIAIAMHNCKVFHCEDVTPDPAEPFGEDGEVEGLSVAPGVTLEDVAEAAKIEPDVLAKLNPQVIGSRLPPVELATTARKSWRIYVPKGKARAAAAEIPATGARQSLGTHVVRWGETLDALAAAFGTSKGHLQNLNDLYPHESPRPGTIVFVPAGRTPKAAPDIAATTEPVAVVPDHAFGYQGRRRVFYEPVFGDTVEDVARVAKVTPADVRRWNHLDDQANLQEGMRLQLHVPEDHHPVDALLYEAPEVTVMTVESARFFDHFVGDGRERVEIVAETGDTWKEIGERYGISLGSLERINHRSRRSKLQAGQRVVVYAQRRLLDKLRAEERAAAARQASDVPAASDGSEGSGKIADGTSGGDGPAAAR